MGVKIIFPELRRESESSVRLNLANSFLSESPKFKRLRLKRIESRRIRVEELVARICQDIRDEVRAE